MSTPRPYQRSDFLRVPGTSGRYLNLQTGETASRRRFQELIGRPLPKQVAQPRQGRGPSKLYVRAYRTYAQERAMSWGEARTNPRFKADWKRLRALWHKEQRGQVVDHTPVKGRPMVAGIDYTPDSEYADLLEELLGRAQGAEYYVGDTP